MKNYIIYIFALLVSFETYSQSQQLLHEDEASVEKFKKGVYAVYNHEFKKAEDIKESLAKAYHSHPAYHLYDAIFAYQKGFYDIETGNFSEDFIISIDSTIHYAELMLKENPKENEAVFFTLMGYFFRSFYYAETGKLTKAVFDAKEAYHHVKHGFDESDLYPEFHTTSGLYYFYAAQYPESRPIVKPFMSFFQKGDKTKGISELEIAVEQALFTKATALEYLTHIHVKYLDEKNEGLKWADQLVSTYPQNLDYKSRQAEAYLMNEDYEKANLIIQKLKYTESNYFQLIGNLYEGIYFEKYKKDFSRAAQSYLRAEEYGLINTKMTYDYLGMTYAGLARVSDNDGEIEEAVSYYEQALKFTEYTEIQTEAKAYLKANR